MENPYNPGDFMLLCRGSKEEVPTHDVGEIPLLCEVIKRARLDLTKKMRNFDNPPKTVSARKFREYCVKVEKLDRVDAHLFFLDGRFEKLCKIIAPGTEIFSRIIARMKRNGILSKKEPWKKKGEVNV